MTATQLVNPDIDRVDAVNGPATGLPFLMFKSLDAPVQAEAEEALAVEVAKSEELPTEEAAPAEEVAKSEDVAPTEEEAFKTWKAQSTGALAEEEVEKALHLEIHEKPEDDGSEKEVLQDDPAAVVQGDPAAPDDALPAEDPTPVEDEPLQLHHKSQEHLPTGLQEILDTFVESYVRYKEAQASGAAAAVAAEGSVEDHLKPPVAAGDIPKAPVTQDQPHEAPPAHHEAPKAEEKPAEEAPAAPEAPAEPSAHEEPPAAAEAPAEAPAPAKAEAPVEEEKPDFPPKKKVVAKSMDDLIAEAVQKALDTKVAEAVKEATEPLLKQIDALERTPVDSGPMFAGQTPGNAGEPLLGRGQAEGAVAKGLVEKSATAQAAPGAPYALAEALKGVHTGKL